MPRGCGLYTIDTTILRNTSKSTKNIRTSIPGNRWASGTPGSAASPRGGTPFVARRAVNLHGCAPASLYPLFSCCAGTPGSAFRPGVGRPPPSGDSAGPPCVTRDTSHGVVFSAGGTAGGNHFKVQALSGDIPGCSGGHSFPQWEDTPSLLPGLNQECPPLAGMSPLEGVSHAHNPQAYNVVW